MNFPSLTFTFQWCLVLSPAEVKLRLAENIPELSLSQWMCKEFPPLVVPPQSVSVGSPFQTKSWRYGGFLFSDFLAVTSVTSHRPLLINAGIQMLRGEFRIVTSQRVVACRSVPRILKVCLLQHDFQTQQAAAPGLRWKKEKLKLNNSQQKSASGPCPSLFFLTTVDSGKNLLNSECWFSFLFLSFLQRWSIILTFFFFCLLSPPPRSTNTCMKPSRWMAAPSTRPGPRPRWDLLSWRCNTTTNQPITMTISTEKKSEFSLQRASSWGHFIRTRVFHQRLDES